MSSPIKIESDNHNAVAKFTEVVIIIRHTHSEVLHVVNKAMVDLYWHIGEYISRRVAKSSWGKSVVAELANYISINEPNVKGFSGQNLWRMKQFYEVYRK